MSSPIFGGGGGGATTLLALTDTPASYSGEAAKLLAVNSAEDAVELITNKVSSVVKGTDEVVNNSTTMQDDDELTFNVKELHAGTNRRFMRYEPSKKI